MLSKSPVAGSLTGEEAVPWVEQACVTRVPCDLFLQSCLGTVLYRLDSQVAVQSGWAFPSCTSAVLPAWETESGVFEQGEGSALFAHLTFFFALLLLLIGGDGC